MKQKLIINFQKNWDLAEEFYNIYQKVNLLKYLKHFHYKKQQLKNKNILFIKAVKLNLLVIPRHGLQPMKIQNFHKIKSMISPKVYYMKEDLYNPQNKKYSQILTQMMNKMIKIIMKIQIKLQKTIVVWLLQIKILLKLQGIQHYMMLLYMAMKVELFKKLLKMKIIQQFKKLILKTQIYKLIQMILKFQQIKILQTLLFKIQFNHSSNKILLIMINNKKISKNKILIIIINKKINKKKKTQIFHNYKIIVIKIIIKIKIIMIKKHIIQKDNGMVYLLLIQLSGQNYVIKVNNKAQYGLIQIKYSKIKKWMLQKQITIKQIKIHNQLIPNQNFLQKVVSELQSLKIKFTKQNKLIFTHLQNILQVTIKSEQTWKFKFPIFQVMVNNLIQPYFQQCQTKMNLINFLNHQIQKIKTTLQFYQKIQKLPQIKKYHYNKYFLNHQKIQKIQSIIYTIKVLQQDLLVMKMLNGQQQEQEVLQLKNNQKIIKKWYQDQKMQGDYNLLMIELFNFIEKEKYIIQIKQYNDIIIIQKKIFYQNQNIIIKQFLQIKVSKNIFYNYKFI